MSIIGPSRKRRNWISGFLAAASLLGGVAQAGAVNYVTAVVGNPNNAATTTIGGTFGSVGYVYNIGKYDVTIGQYTAFLNAVASTDTYFLYDPQMASDDAIAGIAQNGPSGSYTYSVINSSGNSPITYVNWFDAARFANWMANGQPTGAQNASTTENGAYNVNAATSGFTVAKNATNANTGAAPAYWIPTENEWFKAAYYDPTKGGTGGYWTYATRSDSTPGNTIGGDPNQANWNNGNFTLTGNPHLTAVGAFTASSSYYGTFDQSGLVNQWYTDDVFTPDLFAGQRGGNWFTAAESGLSSDGRFTSLASNASSSVGFRLSAVPEPSTYAMALAGLAWGGLSMWRRRRGSSV